MVREGIFLVNSFVRNGRPGPSDPTKAAVFRLTWTSGSQYHRNMDYSRDASLPLGLVSLARALLRATRPKQWTKNLLIFLALFFTINEAWDIEDLRRILSLVGRTTMAFVVFSALSGAVYIFNDIFDVERDRQHPRKRLRAIASGQLPVPVAWGAAATLVAGGLVSGFMLEPFFGSISLAYVGTMMAYTLVLKRLILLDVFAISGGFVLRAVAGAAVIEVPISPWLYICTGLGALFIALAKRRSELALAGEEAGSQRDTLERYTTGLLDQFIAVVATSSVLAYSLYTFTASNLPKNQAMMLTIPFVVYGVFRYMYLVHTKNLGENPEDILVTDVPLIITILLWLATAATILVKFRG